eukprot:1734552-Amphidinium_carterae.2
MHRGNRQRCSVRLLKAQSLLDVDVSAPLIHTQVVRKHASRQQTKVLGEIAKSSVFAGRRRERSPHPEKPGGERCPRLEH